jgi:hydroxymethylglutaryl-CoA lyase
MKIKIFEVGPRDGLQNESKSLKIDEKRKFIELLAAAGHKHIEIGAFVSPEKIPQMAGSDQLVSYLKSNPKISYWALVPNLRGYEDSQKAGLKNIAVFTAASETFNKKNTNASIDESFQRFETFLKDARKKKRSIRGYISTCFVCPYEGKIQAKAVVKVATRLLSLGVQEISIGDTIGAATPYEVKKLVKLLKKEIHIKKIALHFHDTRGTALANVLAGIEEGVRTFDSSSGGLGGCPYAPGAAGNVATDELLYMLHGMGCDTGIDLDKHLIASRYIQSILGHELPSRYLKAGPLVIRKT